MPTPATRLATPLADYAERFHARLGDGHHVASPLGAWLVLALAAPAATGAARAELETVLGTDVASAASTAAALLEHPHPIVLSGAAAWTRADVLTDALRAWLATLPEPVETGGIPTQAAADAWARDRTLGLVERFPLTIDALTVLVLASALATRVSWRVPFDLAAAGELGPASPWSRTLRRVLRTPARGHSMWIEATARAGDVAVHVATAEESRDGGPGLRVASVVAAPTVAAGDVLAAAYEIATRTGPGADATRRSLFDLPLGDGPAWTIREDPRPTRHGGPERYEAFMPAWSADSEHDLDHADLGFPQAARALIALLSPGGYWYEAKQSAVARYDRTGFEAAAVTAIGIRVSAVASMGTPRAATLRFGHPYAVVAVATDVRADPKGGDLQRGPWDGVPVFSAWVRDPEDVPDDPPE